MNFINTYVKTKFVAARFLFHAIKRAWDERNWLAVILTTLWTMFCIIGGILLEPICIVSNAIAWKVRPEVRDSADRIMDEFAID